MNFLLITPLGRLDPRVARTFREHGVSPLTLRTIVDYPRLATALYARQSPTEERLRVQRAYEDAWRARVADHSAALWVLDDSAFAAAWKIKPRLREEWPAERVPYGNKALLLRTFHLPDPPAVEREWRCVVERF